MVRGRARTGGVDAVVIYESLTGHTAKAGHAIAERLTAAGMPTQAYPIKKIDFQALSKADLVIVGSWVDGLVVVGQRPGRLGRIKGMPALAGKRAVVYLTYAIDPGKALQKMSDAVGGAWRGGARWPDHPARQARRGRRRLRRPGPPGHQHRLSPRPASSCHGPTPRELLDGDPHHQPRRRVVDRRELHVGAEVDVGQLLQELGRPTRLHGRRALEHEVLLEPIALVPGASTDSATRGSRSRFRSRRNGPSEAKTTSSPSSADPHAADLRRAVGVHRHDVGQVRAFEDLAAVSGRATIRAG